MVSVPYRGATFLNCGMNATIIYYNGFPSPIGELHFSIKYTGPNVTHGVFPSPIGELHFSINHLQSLQ